MNAHYMGIIIGGLLPTIIFGIGGVFVKASNQQGISLNYFVLLTGIGAIVISIISFFVYNEKSVIFKSGINAFLVGASWLLGVLLVTLALTKYKIPLSIISPLNCTTSLFTVVPAIIIFSEWKETLVIRLIIGTILIIMGAMLVTTTSENNKTQEPTYSKNQSLTSRGAH
jgi:drug/metabolite transporter (DMT)-like permease